MKKIICVIAVVLMFTFLLTSCSGDDGKIGSGNSGTVSDNSKPSSTSSTIKEDLGSMPNGASSMQSGTGSSMTSSAHNATESNNSHNYNSSTPEATIESETLL